MNELKVLIKPILDRTATSQMKGELSKSTTSPISTGTSSGSGISGVLGDKGIGGLLTKATIATAGIGIIAMGVGKMVSRLAEASPLLAGVLQQMKNSINLFLMPIGNMLAMWLIPMSQGMTDFAMKFNSYVVQGGLMNGIAMVMQTLAMSVVNGLIDYFKPTFKLVSDPLGTINTAIAGLAEFFGVGVKSGGSLSPEEAQAEALRQTSPGSRGMFDWRTANPNIQESVTVNINAPVYGVNDLEKAIANGVSKLSSRRTFA